MAPPFLLCACSDYAAHPNKLFLFFLSSVMNPNDHPHGGGEGRAPIGRPSPMSPWGKPTLGKKTRRGKKSSDKLIAISLSDDFLPRRVFLPSVGLPHGDIGDGLPIGARPSPPPCG